MYLNAIKSTHRYKFDDTMRHDEKKLLQNKYLNNLCKSFIFYNCDLAIKLINIILYYGSIEFFISILRYFKF